MSEILKPGESFKCGCGKEHKLTGYVSAHWNERLAVTCGCGRKWNVKAGVVSLESEKRYAGRGK